ncbi:MAG: coA-transferase family protein, partial [Phenylobacterium sp.]|nr:coA-transferase family protein [Phenylobacterium sp.]
KAGAPSEPVRLAQMDAFLGDPATVKAGLRATYRHARYGQMEQIGGLWDFGDLPLQLDRPPPTLGQHSREILGELGLGGQFEALHSAGLVVG